MQASSPWDDWNLDQTFFIEFDRWQTEHPTRKLDRIVDDIRRVLERSDVKDLAELLPSGPIPLPLKGLVLALANLLRLGAVSTFALRYLNAFSEGKENAENKFNEEKGAFVCKRDFGLDFQSV